MVSYLLSILSYHLVTNESDSFSVVKQRMQVHGSKFRSVPETFKTVYKTEGLAAFYVSYPTTLTMTVPFTAVQFSTYEFLK